MYNWDDILIVGDSWCSERHSLLHWPNILLSELTGINEGIPRGKGFAGCSWWSTRKKLFNELNHKPAKVIIIIHTDSSRIPSDENHPMTSNMAFNTIKGRWNTQSKELRAKAAVEYYSHLYSANFHRWAEKRWFEELDDFLISHKDAKIIHFYGNYRNNNSDNNYHFNIGVKVKAELHCYLMPNTQDIKYPNHMTVENNEKMALALKNMILNYPGNGFLYKERLFKND